MTTRVDRVQMRRLNRFGSVALLCATAGCHGLLGDRTSDRDTSLRTFSEYRERAATYYDGGDFERAALQYGKALELRPAHKPSRLGRAYSLMWQDRGSGKPKVTMLLEAEKEFKKVGRMDGRFEAKRIYGMAMTYRRLMGHYDRRGRALHDRGLLKQAEADLGTARDYAASAIEEFRTVIRLEEEAMKGKKDQTSSLIPDARVGLAHCHVVRAEFNLAIAEIEAFAKVAERARKFWEQHRQRHLTVDPLRDPVEDPKTALTPQQRDRYVERINRTIAEEVAIRKVLLHSYLYNNLWREAIEVANAIAKVDPKDDEILYLRGNAYGMLREYRRGLVDLREYRRRQDLSKLTEDLIRLNRQIDRFEEMARKKERSEG